MGDGQTLIAAQLLGLAAAAGGASSPASPSHQSPSVFSQPASLSSGTGTAKRYGRVKVDVALREGTETSIFLISSRCVWGFWKNRRAQRSRSDAHQSVRVCEI